MCIMERNLIHDIHLCHSAVLCKAIPHIQLYQVLVAALPKSEMETVCKETWTMAERALI